MATAHAKFTGEIGVCIATSSPGAFQCSTGSTTRRWTTSRSSRSSASRASNAFGTFEQQENNLERDLRGCRRATCRPSCRPSRRRRSSTPRSEPRGCDLGPPSSSCRTTCREWRCRSWNRETGYRAPVRSRRRSPSFRRERDREGRRDHQRRQQGHLPRRPRLERRDRRGAGGGELAGAGIITALRGKQVVPSDVPFHTQQLGLLGSVPSQHQMQDCDTLVLLGTNYPYGQFLPESGQARRSRSTSSRSRWGCATRLR